MGGAEWGLGVWPSGLELSVARHMLDKGQVFASQFTCFASTKVQILTPEEARGQRASEGVGAERWLERALVGLEEEATEVRRPFPAASACDAPTDPLCSRSQKINNKKSLFQGVGLICPCSEVSLGSSETVHAVVNRSSKAQVKQPSRRSSNRHSLYMCMYIHDAYICIHTHTHTQKRITRDSRLTGRQKRRRKHAVTHTHLHVSAF